MFLATAQIVKSSHNFSWNSIYLSEKRRTWKFFNTKFGP